MPLVLEIVVLWSGLAVLTAGAGAVLGSGAKATAARHGYQPHR